ncbi:MAG TPA: hypothetical protein VM658_02110 [bacterium]|nr:hypothetical protein [bacterium]
MSERLTKSSLSPARRRLLDLMSDIYFGRIERLSVQDGEPMFEPPPKVVRKIKIGGENGPHRDEGKRDFVLKDKVREFFDHLAGLGNGTISRIEVQAGLPFSLEIEEPADR